MNFFKLYMGDYQRDTGALSIAEHGAYFLMLQYHYATEKPLPTGKDLYRLLRCESKADRAAVDAVAKLYWKETPEGLTNGRSTVEIAKAGEQADTNRRIAIEREERRKAERLAHERLNESLHEPCSDREPSHSHSQSNSKTKSRTLSGTPDDAAEILKFLNLKANRNYKAVKANTEMIQARLSEGFTVADIKQVIAKKCREWINNDEMAEYVRPKTLFSRTNFANYAGELVEATDAS